MTRASSVHDTSTPGSPSPAASSASSGSQGSEGSGPSCGPSVACTTTRSRSASSPATWSSTPRWVSAITRKRERGRLITHDRKLPR